MIVAPTPVQVQRVSVRADRLRRPRDGDQWLWLGGGALLAFLVPFVFADVLRVPQDWYYAIYSLSVFTLFGAWLRGRQVDVREFFARHWKRAVALGLVAGSVLAAIVLKDFGTAHPGGAAFGAEILWRGVVYGAADGMVRGGPAFVTAQTASATPGAISGNSPPDSGALGSVKRPLSVW